MAGAQQLPYRTFFGRRVWPAPLLKLYWPFFISGSLTYFLIGYAHTKMMDAPDDKWALIVEKVDAAGAAQKLKAAASDYYEHHHLNQRSGDAPAAHSHH
ncbi:hypothetical protein HDV00_011939 [Rhizophlyctis rosea]|nr:hypothetical protein HDV00_011939 [Rhizophlyctis rosea]